MRWNTLVMLKQYKQNMDKPTWNASLTYKK